MQVLLRYHKGENKKIVPTWYTFIEEILPSLCPITHILAKALAEGVVANEGYQTRSEPFFATKLSKRALKIRWKKEWLHKPVFRRTDLRKQVENKVEEDQSRASAAALVKDSEVHGKKLNSGGDSNLWVKSDSAPSHRPYSVPIQSGSGSPWACSKAWHSTVNDEDMQNALTQTIVRLFATKGCGVNRTAPSIRSTTTTPG